MDYEIIQVTGPDRHRVSHVQYRTADGSEYWTRYMTDWGTADGAVRRTIAGAEKAAAEGRPPGNFPMFVKFNSGYPLTYEEMQDYYREFCKGRGYEVDENMQAYKPGCAPRQTA